MFKHAAHWAREISVELVDNPSLELLKQVEHWLCNEYENSYAGFYCNWDIILHRFEKKQVYLLLVDEKVVGFICWYGTATVKFIDIVEVMPSMRRRGAGRFMMEECLGVFQDQGCVVVGLECPFFSSLPFWRSLKFIDYPIQRSCVNQRMYRILTPALEWTTLERYNSPLVELWCESPQMASAKEATWRWNIQLENSSKRLARPIVFPCQQEWRIRYRKGMQVLADSEVRFFGGEGAFFDGFLIIRELSDEIFVMH